MKPHIISFAILSAIPATGCSPVAHTSVVGEHHFICIDGVEYFNDTAAVPSHNPTPHLKPDGRPFTCNY